MLIEQEGNDLDESMRSAIKFAENKSSAAVSRFNQTSGKKGFTCYIRGLGRQIQGVVK